MHSNVTIKWKNVRNLKLRSRQTSITWDTVLSFLIFSFHSDAMCKDVTSNDTGWENMRIFCSEIPPICMPPVSEPLIWHGLPMFVIHEVVSCWESLWGGALMCTRMGRCSWVPRAWPLRVLTSIGVACPRIGWSCFLHWRLLENIGDIWRILEVIGVYWDRSG